MTDIQKALNFCDMVIEIGMPDNTIIPVWPIETEMAITHPLTVAMVRKFKAALEAKAVPDGFVLVPIEPTREMWAAGADSLINLRDRLNIAHDFITEPVYKAMIQAAQEGGK